MPPEQCPECGRFLKRALVEGLVDAPEPCPKCGLELTAEMFGGETQPPADPLPPPTPATPAAPPTGPGVMAPPSTSVRPPDLPPDDVRDGLDPLEGWDRGVPAGLDAVRDERPFPLDTVVVAGAAVLGAALGAGFGRRPARDAALGALGGAIGAGVARRIWQLP